MRRPIARAAQGRDDLDPFVEACRAARERVAKGESAVPFELGRGDAIGTRAFGVEIEFDIEPPGERRSALARVASRLHAEGLLRRPMQSSYHFQRDVETGWRFETDSTVDGEVISPVLVDSPASWVQVARACEIVRDSGGRATLRTGGHVHVNTADYGSGTASYARLIELFKAHEDALYRLAQNPDFPIHRGLRSCAPNPSPSATCETPAALVLYHSGHRCAINLSGVGRRTARNHVEFRLWDSSLDPAVIQVRVRVSLGLVAAALSPPDGGSTAESPLGSHAMTPNAGSDNFRLLVDRTLAREEDKAQAAALFAITRWQSAPCARDPAGLSPKRTRSIRRLYR